MTPNLVRHEGLLAQLLSHTPGWEVSITRLADKNGVGKDAIRACIRQAVECGYLRVSRSRDAKGMLREAIYELMDPFERNPSQNLSRVSQRWPIQRW